MSKRMQVVLDDAELKAFQRVAKAHGLSLSEWARQALRRAKQVELVGNADKKLSAIRAGARHAFPAPDIDQMLEEIARGYHQDVDG